MRAFLKYRPGLVKRSGGPSLQLSYIFEIISPIGWYELISFRVKKSQILQNNILRMLYVVQ